MCCEQLVCAHCGGRVAEARCSTCRAARDTLHHKGTDWLTYVPALLVAVLVLYVLVTLLMAYLRTL